MSRSVQDCEQSDSNKIEKLPYEVLLDIFSYLDGSDLLACRSVNRFWANVASDDFLWQTKLCDAFGRNWFVVCCEEGPSNPPDLSNLNSIHPCEVYQFLANYIPDHLFDKLPCSTVIDARYASPSEIDESPQRQTFGSSIITWWNQVIRRFSLQTRRRNNQSSGSPQYRFCVFGPGFDQHATGRLFSRLVDTRTKSFEPINIIPGSMGFGAGLTLRLYAQAQAAVLDPSLQIKCLSPGEKKTPKTDDHAYSNKCGRLTRNVNRQSVNAPNPRTRQIRNSIYNKSPNVNNPSIQELIFDLHYLYSLRGHQLHTLNNQLERILNSRLFKHPVDGSPQTDSEALKNLTVTENMKHILCGLNGMIYALDARETVEQSAYLRSEFHAILRGLPQTIADSIPIAILYIMPKKAIQLSSYEPRVIRQSSNNARLLNRDSFSGVEYTTSWRGSLLVPISCLRLFELKNPWRLQKCASNDITSVIQSVMWLRREAPLLSTEQLNLLPLRMNSLI